MSETIDDLIESINSTVTVNNITRSPQEVKTVLRARVAELEAENKKLRELLHTPHLFDVLITGSKVTVWIDATKVIYLPMDNLSRFRFWFNLGNYLLDVGDVLEDTTDSGVAMSDGSEPRFTEIELPRPLE